MADPLDRALAQLNITGLQQSDNPLYQVLNTVIQQLKNINSSLTTQIANLDTGAITDLTGDVTATGPGSVAATIANDAVTYAKMQNVSAASKLLGRGSASGAGNVEEISLGSGLAMTGTSLSASGSGGTVTTSGSPISGNLTKFSGAAVITNGDLSGDVTTSGTLAATIPAHTVIYNKMQQASAGKILLGNGDNGGAHDLEEITLGAGLDISTNVLSATSPSDWNTIITKVNTDTITNSNVLSNDSELLIAVTSGKTYQFELIVLYQSNDVSTNYKWQMTHPGTANVNAAQGFYEYITNGGTQTLISAIGGSGVWPSGTGVQAGIPAINITFSIHIFLVITFNAGGTVHWQQANGNASGGRTSSTMPGSILRVRELD